MILYMYTSLTNIVSDKLNILVIKSASTVAIYIYIYRITLSERNYRKRKESIICMHVRLRRKQRKPIRICSDFFFIYSFLYARRDLISRQDKVYTYNAINCSCEEWSKATAISIISYSWENINHWRGRWKLDKRSGLCLFTKRQFMMALSLSPPSNNELQLLPNKSSCTYVHSSLRILAPPPLRIIISFK